MNVDGKPAMSGARILSTLALIAVLSWLAFRITQCERRLDTLERNFSLAGTMAETGPPPPAYGEGPRGGRR